MQNLQVVGETAGRTRFVYDGRLGELYVIFIKNVLLSIITLGIYRFWGKTRIRRYLWSHTSLLGDRFEYTGTGKELFLGFLLAIALLIGAGLILGLTAFLLSLISEASVVIVFIAIYVGLFLLFFVARFTALRYRLSRTRWRGIRCGMAGSAWRYGVSATFLVFANAITFQLLTPVVSVNLARPRIANTRFGSLPFVFSGGAGDIYGRYVGYYFLNIIAWLVALGIFFAAIGGAVGGLGISFTEEEFLRLFTRPSLRAILLVAALAIGLSVVFSLLILPLRCWWQAYLFRYLVSHSRAGNVLFATAISTRQMWGFLVLNYLIVVLTLGLGWPWVMHRTLRLIAAELWLYGAPDGASIRQPTDLGPRYGEGLLDMFDVSGV
jgi:uncharacterized membrane protein YjgN (DUF898 family)